jgi:hypothetical protein
MCFFLLNFVDCYKYAFDRIFADFSFSGAASKPSADLIDLDLFSSSSFLSMNATASSANGASPVNGDKFAAAQATTPVLSKAIFGFFRC